MLTRTRLQRTGLLSGPKQRSQTKGHAMTISGGRPQRCVRPESGTIRKPFDHRTNEYRKTPFATAALSREEGAMQSYPHEPQPPTLRVLPLWMTIRHFFAYTRRMSFGFPILERKQFVVTCKRCRRDVPAGVREFPFQPIVVPCPLCGELRRYLPSEVFLGQPNSLVSKQARRREI